MNKVSAITTADYCGLSTVGYIAVGTYYNLVEHTVPMWAHFAWACMLLLPLVILPFGSWMYLKIDWSIKKMFDWFKGKNKMPDNMVPYKKTPATEPRVPYTFGLTDNNCLTFTMGYTRLIMNKAGVEQLIEELEFYKSQLED